MQKKHKQTELPITVPDQLVPGWEKIIGCLKVWGGQGDSVNVLTLGFF